MTPIDIQVSRSKVSVEGQAYSLYVGEGGISVLQTAIFYSSSPKPISSFRQKWERIGFDSWEVLPHMVAIVSIGNHTRLVNVESVWLNQQETSKSWFKEIKYMSEIRNTSSCHLLICNLRISSNKRTRLPLHIHATWLVRIHLDLTFYWH